METRSDELDGNLRSGLDEVRATVEGEVKALGEKHSKARRQVERRLVRLEAGTGAQDGPVIVEWRKACVEYKGRGEHRDCVDQDHRQRRVLELEIAIIDEHELTLPQIHTLGTGLTGGSRSGGGRSRWRRAQSLADAWAERNRTLLRRWLRRVFTFGLWRN